MTLIPRVGAGRRDGLVRAAAAPADRPSRSPGPATAAAFSSSPRVIPHWPMPVSDSSIAVPFMSSRGLPVAALVSWARCGSGAGLVDGGRQMVSPTGFLRQGFSDPTVSLVGVFDAMIAGGYVLCLHRHPGLPNFFLLRRCSPTIPLKFLIVGNLLASAPYSMPHPDLLQLFLHFQARIATDRPRMPSGVRWPSERPTGQGGW